MLTLKITTARPAHKLTAFKFFWMKHVQGFRQDVHCARCLVGPYERLVGLSMLVNEPIPLLAPAGAVLYLCGVSTPYRWQNNLHVAVRVKRGATTEVTAYNGDVITFTDAEEIKFDGAAARARFPERGADFLTCRNFQFGAHAFPE